MSSSARTQQQVGEHTHAVVQQTAVCRRQYVRFDHCAVDPHMVSGFHPRLPRRLQQTTVDALPSLRRHIADRRLQRRLLRQSKWIHAGKNGTPTANPSARTPDRATSRRADA